MWGFRVFFIITWFSTSQLVPSDLLYVRCRCSFRLGYAGIELGEQAYQVYPSRFCQVHAHLLPSVCVLIRRCLLLNLVLSQSPSQDLARKKRWRLLLSDPATSEASWVAVLKPFFPKGQYRRGRFAIPGLTGRFRESLPRAWSRKF